MSSRIQVIMKVEQTYVDGRERGRDRGGEDEESAREHLWFVVCRRSGLGKRVEGSLKSDDGGEERGRGKPEAAEKCETSGDGRGYKGDDTA